jgi:HEAT repeat protein
MLEDREAVPHLLAMLGSASFELNRAAAYALTRLGQVEATADAVVSLLHYEDVFLPSMLIDLHRRAPAAVVPAIARGMQRGTAKQRETLSWIAAALHDPALVPFVEELRTDREERVGAAAAWAGAALRGAALAHGGAG